MISKILSLSLLSIFAGYTGATDVPPPPWDLFEECCAAKTEKTACHMYSYACNPCISPHICCTENDDYDDSYACEDKKEQCEELNAWIKDWCQSGEMIPPAYAPPWV